MARMLLKFESAVIKEIPITSSVFTIGRKSDNDLVIDHPAVSGHHCRIILQGETYFIEDLNSTNGTLLNSKKILKAGIHHQDVITCAKHTLIFLDDRPSVSPQEGVVQPINQPVQPVQAAQPIQSVEPVRPVQLDQPVPPLVVSSPSASTDASLAAESQLEQLMRQQQQKFDKVGNVRVVEGVTDQIEYSLTENSTYIGKSDRVAIRIRGMFAPEVAAMVNKKSNGYSLVAIKEGFPKVNGIVIQGEHQLNEGDIIELGGTKLQFYLKSSSK